MGRRTIGGLLAAAVVALTGCTEDTGGTAGTRADRTFTPAAGICHRTDVRESDRTSYDPVGCDDLHEAETVHVDTFAGGDRATRPAENSPARRTAFDACDTAATGHLGGEWRGARLLLRVVVPTGPAWEAGERWYRCDLSEIGGMEFDDPSPRQGSLRGVLGGRSDLAYGCLNVVELPGEEIGGVSELDSCAIPHHAEYAGVWRAPDQSYADLQSVERPVWDGCRTVAARYLSVPAADDLDDRVKVIFRLPPEQQWDAGDRGVRCILWLPDHSLTRSLRGARLSSSI